MSGEATVLPSLRCLIWRQAIVSDAGYLLFESPSLRDVEILLSAVDWSVLEDNHDAQSCERHAVKVYLDTLPVFAPSLERLRIIGHCPLHWPINVPQLSRLRVADFAEVGVNDIGILHDLASLSFLEELTIRLGNRASNVAFSHPSFVSLRSLRISGDAKAVTSFLDNVDSCRVHTLTMHTIASYTLEDSWECLESVRRRFHACLRHLYIRFSITRNVKNTVCVIDVMGPLLGLTLLQYAHLRFGGYMCSRDADMESMASAWPQLQELYLDHDQVVTDDGPSFPSLQSLVSFTKHCPNLRKLSIPLDARCALPSIVGVAPHLLRSLTLLGNILVNRADGLEQFFCSLFPELQDFHASASNAEMRGVWSGLETFFASKRPGQSTNTRDRTEKNDGLLA